MLVVRSLNSLVKKFAHYCALLTLVYSLPVHSTPLSSEWVEEFDRKFFGAEQDVGLLKGGATQICATSADRASQEAFILCVERMTQKNKQDADRLNNELRKTVNNYAEKYKSPERLDTSLLDGWFKAFQASKNTGDSRYKDKTNGWTHYLSDRIQQYCKDNKAQSCERDFSEIMKPAIDFYPQALGYMSAQKLLKKWRVERDGDLGQAIVIRTNKRIKDDGKREGFPQTSDAPQSKGTEVPAKSPSQERVPPKKQTGSSDGGGGFSGKGADSALNSCVLGFNTQMGAIGGRPCSFSYEGNSGLTDALTPAPAIARAANITTDTYFQRLREKAFEKYYGTFISRFGEIPFEGIPNDCKAPEYAEIVKNAPKIDPSKKISTDYRDYKNAAVEITSLQDDATRFQKEIKAMQDERRKHGKSSKTYESLTKMIAYRKDLVVSAGGRISALLSASPLLVSDVDPSVDFLKAGSLPLATAVSRAVKPDGNVITADAKLIKGKLKLMDQARSAMKHFCSAQWSDLVRSKELTQAVLLEPGNEVFTQLQECAEGVLKRKDNHLKIANAFMGTGCLAATFALPLVGGAACAGYTLASSAQHLDHALHEKNLVDACRLVKDAVCSEKEWKEAAGELHHAQVHMAIAVAGVGIYAWAEKAEQAAHAIEHVRHIALGSHHADAALKTVTAVTKSQSALKGISDVLKDPIAIAKLGPQKVRELSAKMAEAAKKLKPLMEEEKVAGMAHKAHAAEHTYAEISKLGDGLKAFGLLIKGI